MSPLVEIYPSDSNKYHWIDKLIVSAIIIGVQYGYGIVASIPLFAAGLLIFQCRGVSEALHPTIVIPSILLTILATEVGDRMIDYNLARDMRLAFQLLVMLLLQRSIMSTRMGKAILGTNILALTIVVVVFAAAQTVGQYSGYNLFVPDYLFINSDDAALASNWITHAQENNLDSTFRASAFYSEPSYLGLILIFLHILAIYTAPQAMRPLISIACVAGSLLSMSGLGILGNSIIALVHYAGHRPALAASTLSAAMLLTWVFGETDNPMGRLEKISAGQDESANIRIIQPITILSDILENHPFGIPLSGVSRHYQLQGQLPHDGDLPFQNGLFNILFCYGWLGFTIVYLLLRGAPDIYSKIFTLVAIMQNGAFSELDKVVLIGTVCMVSRAAQGATLIDKSK